MKHSSWDNFPKRRWNIINHLLFFPWNSLVREVTVSLSYVGIADFGEPSPPFSPHLVKPWVKVQSQALGHCRGREPHGKGAPTGSICSGLSGCAGLGQCTSLLLLCSPSVTEVGPKTCPSPDNDSFTDETPGERQNWVYVTQLASCWITLFLEKDFETEETVACSAPAATGTFSPKANKTKQDSYWVIILNHYTEPQTAPDSFLLLEPWWKLTHCYFLNCHCQISSILSTDHFQVEGIQVSVAPGWLLIPLHSH